MSYKLTVQNVSDTALIDVIATGNVVMAVKHSNAGHIYDVTVEAHSKVQLMKLVEALTREHDPNKVVHVMDLKV